MRIDQYLCKTLLLKQRSAAKILCEQQFIRINGQYVKPSKHVSIGDVIDIETAKATKHYRVLLIPSGNVKKSDRGQYYEEIF